MKTEILTSKILGDSYYKIEHPTGLTIFVYPQKDYTSTYGIFGTKYGSINNAFTTIDGKNVTVPDGIAHYLEHKLFESQDEDAFARYTKIGANANAYTSFDKTCYLFSCTENSDEALRILLDFVQSPYFTEETVAKEQGIIGQEIKMYDDNPDWRVLFNLFEIIYHSHPVKTNIAGTVESISKITPDMLYTCYNNFYNLHNMVLVVSGNVTKEQVIKIADECLKPCDEMKVKAYIPDEPASIVKNYTEETLSVSMPIFQLGYKETLSKAYSDEKALAATDVLLNLLASDTSPLYKKLIEAQLINSSFAYEYFEGEKYSLALFGGESRNPKAAAEIIRDEITRLNSKGIDKESFDIAKKCVYGEAIHIFNNTESIANSIVAMYFSDRDLYKYIEALAKLTIEDVELRLKSLLNNDFSALSVINTPTSN